MDGELRRDKQGRASRRPESEPIKVNTRENLKRNCDSNTREPEGQGVRGGILLVTYFLLKKNK